MFNPTPLWAIDNDILRVCTQCGSARFLKGHPSDDQADLMMWFCLECPPPKGAVVRLYRRGRAVNPWRASAYRLIDASLARVAVRRLAEHLKELGVELPSRFQPYLDEHAHPSQEQTS